MQEVHAPAVFTWDEQAVVGTDEATNAVVLWDARTGRLLQRLTGAAGGHR